MRCILTSSSCPFSSQYLVLFAFKSFIHFYSSFSYSKSSLTIIQNMLVNIKGVVKVEDIKMGFIGGQNGLARQGKRGAGHLQNQNCGSGRNRDAGYEPNRAGTLRPALKISAKSLNLAIRPPQSIQLTLNCKSTLLRPKLPSQT